MENLRGIINRPQNSVALAKVYSVDPVKEEDRSKLDCIVTVYPLKFNTPAKMALPLSCEDGGVVQLPRVDDLVIVIFAGGVQSECYIIARIPNDEDLIPKQSLDGSLVIAGSKTRNDKVWVTSNKKIFFSRGDNPPSENLVLGQAFKVFAEKLLDVLIDGFDKKSKETHLCSAPGYNSALPDQTLDYSKLKQKLEGLKTSPILDEMILSSFSFTEK